MACGPCQQSRSAFVGAFRSGNIRGAAQAVATAVAINVDKIRGVNVAEKYGGRSQQVVKATPYRRPERTT